MKGRDKKKRYVVYFASAVSILYGLIFIVKFHHADFMTTFSAKRQLARYNEKVPYRHAIAFLNNKKNTHRVVILNPTFPEYFLDIPYAKILGSNGAIPYGFANGANQAVNQLDQLDANLVIDTIHQEGETYLIKDNDMRLELIFEGERARIYQRVIKSAI